MVAVVRGKGKPQVDKGSRRERSKEMQGQNKYGHLQTSTAANKPSTAARKICSPPGKWHVFPSTHRWSTVRTKWSVWPHKDNVILRSQQRAHTNSCRISAFKANLVIHAVTLILTLFCISMALSIQITLQPCSLCNSRCRASRGCSREHRALTGLCCSSKLETHYVGLSSAI